MGARGLALFRLQKKSFKLELVANITQKPRNLALSTSSGEQAMLDPHAAGQQLARVHPGEKTQSRNPTEGLNEAGYNVTKLLLVEGRGGIVGR